MSNPDTPVIIAEIRGGEDVAAYLLNIDHRLARGVAISALRAGASPMLAAIKAAASQHRRTGLMQRSLKAQIGTHDGVNRWSMLFTARTTAKTVARYLHRGGRHAWAEDVTKRFSPSAAYRVFYAYFVERGHGGPRPAPAHPFGGPAFDATIPRTAEIVEDKLVEGMGV